MEKKVPWKQALSYTIERALIAYDFLEETQKEYLLNIEKKVDASINAGRVRVLCDGFSGYVTTLVDGGKERTYSLKSCAPEIFNKVKSLDIVKKCKRNRNNRFVHEADSYGHFVSVEEILGSDIRSILEDIRVAIVIR